MEIKVFFESNNALRWFSNRDQIKDDRLKPRRGNLIHTVSFLDNYAGIFIINVLAAQRKCYYIGGDNKIERKSFEWLIFLRLTL